MLSAMFSDAAVWFSVPALIGTLFFVLRIAMMLVLGDTMADGGLGDATDFGGDPAGADLAGAGPGDPDVTSAADAVDHAHSSTVLRFLSIQTLLAFVMGFGWGGLAAFRGFDAHPGLSALLGVVCGAAMVALLLWVLEQVTRLNESGNIPRSAILGCEGEVYVRVPGEFSGIGRVRVVVNGRQRMLSARTQGPEIARHARIRVTKLAGDASVLVEPVTES